jgi:hypothetical protein
VGGVQGSHMGRCRRWLDPPDPRPHTRDPFAVHGRGKGGGGALAGGGVPLPPSRAPSLCPATVRLTPSANAASMAFATDSNRPPLRQPPPTACPTAPGAASEAPALLMHPLGGTWYKWCLDTIRRGHIDVGDVGGTKLRHSFCLMKHQDQGRHVTTERWVEGACASPPNGCALDRSPNRRGVFH